MTKSPRALQKVVILGAGGHAREQLDLISAINEVESRYDVLGFLVDPQFAPTDHQIRGLPVLGAPEWIAENRDEIDVVAAIGASSARRQLVERVRHSGGRFSSLIHPSAQIGREVVLGEGIIVSAGAVLTSDIQIGAHSHINVSSSVSHDCVLGEFVSLAPGVHLSGGVQVDDGCQLGAGTVFSDHTGIGDWSITGAGTVVISKIPANCTVVGVPARVVAQRPEGWHRDEGLEVSGS
jgi:sugar O-acyltransferase (sialic acid O-acetyltransferase NeuD family)